ncbi:hypothetical protein, partial [Dactylosporangium maewongense]|uniref:hypothetical protein n=1 Tax=Dactylosporangium maewongense TaxID=634393 RepID=UPI0031D6E28D
MGHDIGRRLIDVLGLPGGFVLLRATVAEVALDAAMVRFCSLVRWWKKAWARRDGIHEVFLALD